MKRTLSLTAVALLLTSTARADIDHLSLPTLWDNVGGTHRYGQTFLADDLFVLGFEVYIGDPTRPNDEGVNALVGPASIKLYDVASLSAPILLATSAILSASETSSGLSAFSFQTPVPTVPGGQYFFAFETTDLFGIGMRSLGSSTYAGGVEAYFNPATGQVVAEPSGRDMSFKVSTVPEPTSGLLLLLGAVGLVCRRRADTGFSRRK